MVATTSTTGLSGLVRGTELARFLPSGGTVRTTQDVDAASIVLSECYAELDLRVPHATGPFGMRLECVDLPDVQLAMLDLSNASAHTVPYPAYTVCFPVRGRVR